MANILLRVSLLSSFMAISSAVHADHNFQHRPNQPAEYGAFNQAGPTPAASKAVWQGRPSPQRNSRKSCTYQGGPKSGLWACR